MNDPANATTDSVNAPSASARLRRGFGWGVFGTAITPKIAVATLVLHLIYGATLGWGLRRSH